jgi:hypothetical protein
MVLHALPYYIGDFIKLVVFHFKKGMKYAPLYRLKTILKIRNGPVLDYIGSVFKKISVEDTFYVSHNRSSR